MTYADLTTDYYKAVNQQAALDGARTSIMTILRGDGVANPILPPLRAGTDARSNALALEREVARAVTKYAARAGGKGGIRAGAAQITYAAMSGMLRSVRDKYTVFLSPKQYAEINQSLDGTQFGGIGLTYDIDDKTHDIRVQNVIPDGPADKAGVLSSDFITQINGQSVPALIASKAPDLQSEVIQSLLRGLPGTTVALTIDRAGVAEALTITRAMIHSPSVLARMLPDRIGYLQLAVFGADTGNELAAALPRLDSKGAKAYILDLRYDPGGYLKTAVEVSSQFIATGPIVTVRSRNGRDTVYDADHTAAPSRPLAVLVNHYSASASEITAGAIQDRGVGTIIGTRTYGKGVVQSIFPFRDGSAVKITTARYLTPHGRDINSIGIRPQILSQLPEDARVRLGDPETDVQLKAAITYLQSRIAPRTVNPQQSACLNPLRPA